LNSTIMVRMIIAQSIKFFEIFFILE